ncbi:arylamine N-acetyltransferase [Kitasatospora sp. NPDC058965]|uniref:arylamine N-acetyltransferase family protein n=1 Tax=Kitasatospora sp. NPDC058965 TaxID=3346682 RepID=UPI0036B2FEA5
MDRARVDAYLDRIGADRPARPDLAGLRALQGAHLAAVPFESLSVHLGEPIVLEPDALVAKLVDRRRGGFCYELNGAFAALLTALGYRVELLAARVYQGEAAGPPFDHLALRMELDEPWLADVGFGRFSAGPLRLAERGDQADRFGTFRVVEQGPDLDVSCDGKLQYRLDRRAYALADFAPTCWYQATSPASPFTRQAMCSITTPTGRTTLTAGRLIRTTDASDRTEQELPTEEEQAAAYREHFGIALTAAEVKQLNQR